MGPFRTCADRRGSNKDHWDDDEGIYIGAGRLPSHGRGAALINRQLIRKVRL